MNLISDANITLLHICNIPVLWSDKRVACDKCDQWYHAKCINMSSQVYHGLDMSTNWYCNKCETPNDISALYQPVWLDSTHTGSYMSGDSKHINNNMNYHSY